jgi:hypothetical protein
MDIDLEPELQPNRDPTPLGSYSPEGGRMYIEIEYHPHSGRPNEIISLDAALPTSTSASPRPRRSIIPKNRAAWAPFPTRADFEWAETAYLSPRAQVNARLEGMHSGRWCDNTRITMRNADDLHMYLERARHYVVEVSYKPCSTGLR